MNTDSIRRKGTQRAQKICFRVDALLRIGWGEGGQRPDEVSLEELEQGSEWGVAFFYAASSMP
jgi:hypothetical protein